MNTCPTEPRLTACLLGDLPKAEADAVHAHIESCPACRAAAAELTPLLDTLRAALASDAAAPLTLDPVRLATILATPPPHRARPRRPRFWLASVIGLAATGIIVLSASLFFPGFESNPYRISKGSGSPLVACDTVLVPLEHEAADADGDGLRDIVVRKAKKRPGNMNERAELGATDTETLPVDIRKGWSEDRDKRGRDGHSQNVEPTTTPEPVGVHKPEPIASDDINGGVFYDNAPPDKAPARASPEMRAKLQIAIADIAKAREDYPRAKAQYERVVTGPISGRTEAAKHAELKIAEVDRLMRNYDAALELLEKLDKNGDASVKSEARFQKAQIQFDQEDYAGAREELARVREIAPNHSEAALLEGKMNLKMGKLIEATDIRFSVNPSESDIEPSVDGPPVINGSAVEQVKSPVLHEPAAHRTANAKRPIISKYSPDPVLWDFPRIDDSKVSEEVEKDSRKTFTYNVSGSSAKGGKMGAGGGSIGGWPDGMQDTIVRFIRMKYDGAGWDDGMDEASRADLNFLDFFRNLTGFKTATKPESHSIALLARYPKGFAPPFVYMTGDGNIGVSQRDVSILREYIQGGGMLFADCGSPQWNGQFRNFIQRVFPGEKLLNIADDDVIFQIPFGFEHGAPPLWHHGGDRALGVKHKGRWAVFYHPGDINDAWKNNRGGLSAAKAEGALEMGVNIVYYAFTQYLELTRKLRNGEKPDAPAIPAPPTPVPAPPAPVPAAPPKKVSTPVKPRVPAVFNPFVAAAEQPLSTFAIDVDTASYTRTRQAILAGQLPEPEAVRTEEVVNAFDYGDRAPDLATFRIFVEGSPSPFGHGTSLIRLGIKGRRLGREESRPAVLTFVVDASGSMAQPDRFGLARLALDELIGRLGKDDRIQLVAFNDTARVLADPVAATGRKEILAAFDRIQCTGSTHLESGLRLAYDRAAAAFRPGAENRVILISDGVANLGTGAAADILTHIDAARRQGITLAVFGVGRGTYNDEMLEQLANRGDGTYRFLDSADEVRRAFVDDLAATLYNIASDVKIQVEWLPAAVSRYRQLGYENRALTAEQFRDDTVDAGEVGSGQSVTALYEIERAALAPRAAAEAPLGMVRVRYRPATGGPVAEISRPILAADLAAAFPSARPQFRIAACAAAFAERLRGSPYANGFSFADVANALRPAVMEFTLDARLADLLRLIEAADRLAK
jgi:Ca-activated chloride channel family protein